MIQTAWLNGGKRLHLNHGPIDLVVEAFGAPDEVRAAYRQLIDAFDGVLEGLVAELAALRRPAGGTPYLFRGAVARRMVAAVRPFNGQFITPMASVAGAVADHMLAAMVAGRTLDKAYVNNGGDIALYLAPGETLNAGIVSDLATAEPDAIGRIAADSAIRGLATSGWRGRSLSFGIADAVTVLARDAARADAAATLIANAVTVDHPAVRRQAANAVRDETELGERPVTVAVGTLPSDAVNAALAAGVHQAEAYMARGLITSAYLRLQDRHRVVGGESGTRLVGQG